ncbi:ribosome small subunit-dependent GTPase A [Thalassolituus sp. C2-1]|uniref:ribosome small subunit-dependent GTPase A n=1 Tax=Venatorbacter sp. C2-1 TaxID=2597518 RepID=UPI00118FDF4E|nr:ribosome small subunit-dependent GTPase A [Thalassolituus sp. C2-1]TVV42836.1 ribosome small subunit-dependent GTPase A [Thalassolituus sp. C2-1]
MTSQPSLAGLGWQAFFQQQLSLEEWQHGHPVRVLEQHKTLLEVSGGQGIVRLPYTPAAFSQHGAVCVGDWLLLDNSEQPQIIRRLERLSCFQRRAAGIKAGMQLIAANVDTAFIVCSLNDDFNLNRIERYLSIVHESGAEAVVVLSKADLCEQAEDYRQQVQKLDPLLAVVSVSAFAQDSIQQLMPWCGCGKTVALLGSSGAGKSTLSNQLLGQEIQATAAIREDDSKGRHTTTRRSLLSMPGGAMILDTPGMRELQLADCADGLAQTFADIEELAGQCRFADCGHSNEPGCAVRQALHNGMLDERRLRHYEKLQREQQLNSATLAQRRAGERETGKLHKRILNERKRQKHPDH